MLEPFRHGGLGQLEPAGDLDLGHLPAKHRQHDRQLLLRGTDRLASQYDPATGQFISRDPLDAATHEPYAYAGGDPINKADPSGLREIDPDGGKAPSTTVDHMTAK